MYKDLMYPGGIREDGFAALWGNQVKSGVNVRTEQLTRPTRDEWFRSLVPDLEKITVPALICGSFSDQNLHTRGSFRAFERISSHHKWLYTHRSGKWATYYSEDALSWQFRFFDCFLKGHDNGMKEVPAIRLAAGTNKEDTDDLHLFAGVRKLREGQQLTFEGSYGFAYDLVTKGWLKASLRALNEELSRPGQPEHDFDVPQPLKHGEVVELQVALLPSATFLKKGDILRLNLRGGWFFVANPLAGAGPSAYQKSPPGTCVVHTGADHRSYLLVPQVSPTVMLTSLSTRRAAGLACPEAARQHL